MDASSDTIEDRIHALLFQKQCLFDQVMAQRPGSLIDDLSSEHVQNRFSDEELLGLFNLNPPDAVTGKTSLRHARRDNGQGKDWRSLSH